MSNLIADGDSITAGTVGGVANAWPTKLAALRGFTLTDRAVSGAQAGDRAFAGLGFVPNPADKHAVMLGTNDERIYQEASKSFFKPCLMAAICTFALASRLYPRSSGWTGPWGNTQVTSGGRASNVLGQKLDSPAAVITGNVLYVGMLLQNAANAGGATIVRVDGVQVATIDSTGIGAQTGNGLQWPLGAFRIPLANGGPHQVEFEQASSGKMQYVEWIAGNGQPSLPEVYVSNIIRSNGYANGGSDTIVSEYNAILAQLVSDLASDGLKVTLVDNWSVINPLTDLADSYHPTSAGHIKIANQFNLAIPDHYAWPTDHGTTLTVNVHGGVASYVDA